ncbi:MAG: DAK2 domain-containing protein, partial [Clostridia bacterium]|nr:DAK2 domain-containing protein [Clostridia bacterium]
MITQLDVKKLAELFENGYRNLYANEQAVNDLNVFPVPDGDTGTNMVRTLEGGLNISAETVSPYMQAVSRGVLMSARGNSGVILSQFIRGIAEGAADGEALSTEAFISALENGVKSAYGAVIEPTEGTMLTVIREGVEAVAEKQVFSDFEALFQFLIEAMKRSLANTPELLPVLKEANVVDSGGVGIVSFFEGMLLKLQGVTLQEGENTQATKVSASAVAFGPDSVLEYGYCTEFILQLMYAKTDIQTFELQPMIDYLESIGNSIVAVQDKDIVKVHVHTFTPEKALGFARNFGEFITVKIENMSVQHNETAEKKAIAERVKYAVVAVASGAGLKQYFSEIGANVVIDGGQTQNPSAEDFVSAFKSINAEHIIVLPNNSNIVMTAELARDMYTEADVRVIPTKSIAAGYSALTMMNPWLDNVDDFIEEMENGANAVSSIAVAQAVHSADLHGMHIDKDAYMGILDGKICCAERDAVSAAV